MFAQDACGGQRSASGVSPQELSLSFFPPESLLLRPGVRRLGSEVSKKCQCALRKEGEEEGWRNSSKSMCCSSGGPALVPASLLPITSAPERPGTSGIQKHLHSHAHTL